MLRIVLCCLFALFVLAGCSATSTRERSPEGALQAESLFADGEFEAAAREFMTLAANQRSRRDAYRLRAAEAWREEGNLSEARAALTDVGPRRLEGDERLRLSLLQAELALDAGDAADALTRSAWPIDSVPEAFRERFHDLRANALERSAQPFEAAAELALLDAYLTRDERVENSRRILRLLTQTGDDALARGSAGLPPRHPLYVHAGRMLTGRGLPLPRPYERTSNSANATARGNPDVDGYLPYARVALLLPFEGPLAAASQSVRDGFFAAYYAESRARPAVSLVDSGDTAASALEGYRRAVAEGAEFVVGPLTRDAVAALLESAELSVSLLTLNRGGALPPPPGSVSFALAPEDEGVAAAERMLQRGWRRVIVAMGDDESAQRSVAAFRERFEQGSGQVVAQMRLPDDTPDYASAIRQAMQAAGIAAPAASTGDPIPDAPANHGVDGVFLAARSGQARLFAPQLRVAGIYDLPIIATSQVAAGGANARLDRELDGVEFTELPWLIGDRPGLPARAPLGEALESARGGGARLFAFGLDAFRLIGYLDHLAADPNARLPGATGELSLDGFGQVQRRPAWARYANGHVQPAPDGGLIGEGMEFRQP
jgi:outer membrane PBP1 activator LpoA protein